MYSGLTVVVLINSEKLWAVAASAAVLAAMINFNYARAVNALYFTAPQARSIRFDGDDPIPQPKRWAGFTTDRQFWVVGSR